MTTIYLGASNRWLGLSQYTIYKDKPEKLIETLKPKIPSAERLFVSIDEFVEAEKELEKPESLIYAAWKQSKGAR